MAEKMTGMKILSKFFGKKLGQTLKEFGEEIKKLSPSEKDELCTLAAVELGVEYEKK